MRVLSNLNNPYTKKLWDSGIEEFGPCGFCEEPITRKEVGRNDIALDIQSPVVLDVSLEDGKAFVKLYHNDCCPCQTDQKLLNGLWQEIDLRFDNPEGSGTLPYEYVGMLSRCPFCFRIYDDDGKEVAL